MDYVTGLAFDESPDYRLLKNYVLEAATFSNLNIFDGEYDWSARVAVHHNKKNNFLDEESKQE